MTAAYNLSQLANRANSSGQLDISTASTGVLAVANGGTGAATHTANNVLLGNGATPFIEVAPGSSGNVLTSNGTKWQSVAGSSGTGKLLMFTKITSSGTFTKQSGSNLIVYEIYGGGGGGGVNAIGGGGGGGMAGAKTTGSITSPAASISAVIGAGGASGSNGTASSFNAVTSTGGLKGIADFANAGGIGQTGVGIGGAGGVVPPTPGGAAAANSAAGGGGAASGGLAAPGGAGGSGVIYVWEYS